MRMRAIAWATPLIFSVAAAVYLLTVLRAPANASFGWLVATAAILGFLLLAMERMMSAVARGDSGRGGDAELTAAPDSKRAARRREIEREKLLTLRSLKELEFDHGMGKVSDADFSQMATALRERALRLIRDLDQVQSQTAAQAHIQVQALAQVQTPVQTQAQGQTRAAARTRACAACSTHNDDDAQFCKRCGSRL